MNCYLSGIRFGMVLQLAIGPLCLMVFNTAQNAGFFMSLLLVFAIALGDTFYILLACLGVSKFINNNLFKKISIPFCTFVLLFFGISIMLNTSDVNFLPMLNLKYTPLNVFVQGLVLTLSNPLTILFWGGVLTSEIIKNNFSRKELFIFSFGLVSATILFLTFVALFGTVTSTFITDKISRILNIAIGAAICCFGLKMLFWHKNIEC